MTIQFDRDLQVGISILDDQHKTLLSLLGELEKAIEYGRDRQLISTLFDVVENAAYRHFSLEEEMLEGHANRDSHALEHYRMLKGLKHLKHGSTHMQKRAKLSDESMFARLASHILSRDIPQFRPAQSQHYVEPEIIDRVKRDKGGERRQFKRIPKKWLVDGYLTALCRRENAKESRSARVVDISIGGIGIECRQGYAIGERVEIQCKIGKSYTLNEQARIVYAQGRSHGAAFIQLSQETRSFLTRLGGAVHR